jgi:hypothetical protein
MQQFYDLPFDDERDTSLRFKSGLSFKLGTPESLVLITSLGSLIPFAQL